jgi:hypothetical protein
VPATIAFQLAPFGGKARFQLLCLHLGVCDHLARGQAIVFRKTVAVEVGDGIDERRRETGVRPGHDELDDVGIGNRGCLQA